MIQLFLMTIGWLGSLTLILYGTRISLLREVNPIASLTLEHPIIAITIALVCISLSWISYLKIEKKPKYLVITTWVIGLVLFINFLREIILLLVYG